MTFDRFMRQFFAEELKEFPNTVYKNDCWYSFTPQGLMYQVFVLRDRCGAVSLEYGITPLIAPLDSIAGNSMKKLVFGRPSNKATFDHMNLHPQNDYSYYDFRTGAVEEPRSVKILRELLSEVIIPYFRSIQTIQEIYTHAQKCAEHRIKNEDCLFEGVLDQKPYVGPWLYIGYRAGTYICAYLRNAQEGLAGVRKIRGWYIAMHRYTYQTHYPQISTDTDPNYQAVLKNCENIGRDCERFLLLPDKEQQRRLREIFEENRVKIRDLLKIDPKFDVDFIFPEG